jgi:hypothetical protein
MNAMEGTNRRSRVVEKAAVAHTSGTSVIADNSRDVYASNQIFEDDSPFTPRPDRPVAHLDQSSRKPLSHLVQHDIYGIAKPCIGKACRFRHTIGEARKSRNPSDRLGVGPVSGLENN